MRTNQERHLKLVGRGKAVLFKRVQVAHLWTSYLNFHRARGTQFLDPLQLSLKLAYSGLPILNRELKFSRYFDDDLQTS